MDKKALRKFVREKKTKYSHEEFLKKSSAIFQQIAQKEAFTRAKTIMIYWAMKDEVQTQDFIQKWAEEKQFILPTVNGDELELKEYTGVEELVAGEQFGIPEPKGELFTDYDSIELVIIPGVAFDKKNNRMGRGRGYYDKFLSSLKAPKYGICYDFQFFEKIPYEAHDIQMDQVFIG